MSRAFLISEPPRLNFSLRCINDIHPPPIFNVDVGVISTIFLDKKEL